jgi:hypothetical protein
MVNNELLHMENEEETPYQKTKRKNLAERTLQATGVRSYE